MSNRFYGKKASEKRRERQQSSHSTKEEFIAMKAMLKCAIDGLADYIENELTYEDFEKCKYCLGKNRRHVSCKKAKCFEKKQKDQL